VRRIVQTAVGGLDVDPEGIDARLQVGLLPGQGVQSVLGLALALLAQLGHGFFVIGQVPLHFRQVPLHAQFTLGGQAAGEGAQQNQSQNSIFPSVQGSNSSILGSSAAPPRLGESGLGRNRPKVQGVILNSSRRFLAQASSV
jgi:hypothetical protein